MNDITKHKWSSRGKPGSLARFDYQSVDNTVIHDEYIYLSRDYGDGVCIDKNDSIAIAKHFYSQLQTIQERMDFFQAMSGELQWDAKNRLAMSNHISQSETTKHYPGAIGDMRRHD